MHIIGDIKGKNVVMTDDIIDTAGTVANGATALMERGAREVHACCTHPVLSDPAFQYLAEAPIKELVVTNTIPIPPEKMSPQIKVLSVAPLLGEAIIRIHKDMSVSKLFS